MAELLYTLRATREAMLADGPNDAESRVLAQHGQYISHLTEEGVVELAGRIQHTDQTTSGATIFEAHDEMAARKRSWPTIPLRASV